MALDTSFQLKTAWFSEPSFVNRTETPVTGLSPAKKKTGNRGSGGYL